ncbi:MAG: copper chaperone PCu(A)C [Luteimonas sp.]
MKRPFVLLVVLAALGCSACTRDCAPEVRDGWIRLGPARTPMMAGFGRIENHCPTPITILSVSSSAFADTSLHETRIVGGMSRMRGVAELRVAPDDAAVLKPGGLHLMLMQPRAPLQAGSRVAVEFQLSDGRKLLGEFVVRRPAP